MFLRNTITAVIAIAVVGIPSSAGAVEVFGPDAAVGAWYGTAPVGSPPPTARLPYYEYGPWAAYERPVPYPDRPYTPPPRYANPAPLFWSAVSPSGSAVVSAATLPEPPSEP
jgi:hypothetical protein